MRIVYRGGHDMAKFLLALAILWLAFGSAGAAQETCVVEVPVYNESGSRLAFRVTRVSPKSDREMNLLTAVPQYVSAEGDKVVFRTDSLPKDSLRERRVLITLEDPGGHTVVRPVILRECPQRASVRFGQSERPVADVAAVAVRGHLTGCKFDGDWWVRALPMFGGTHPWEDAINDGYVKPDGTFDFTVNAEGVRHLMVVGKGKDPIKAVGFDVTLGENSDLGSIDLRGQCPK
jgi:hypothetical protein